MRAALEFHWLTLRQWSWDNNYSPGPEVYDQLWHIRREPATVTPFLPTECPVPNARSRILDRRQTEGDIQRNFYVVELIHLNSRESSFASAEGAGTSSTELLHVDLSCILKYVSPDELERYENEQFRIEAEAEAIAMRVEAEELARRRLEKNARMVAAGHGSRMAMGPHQEARPRGRPRGRGRGRGRGSWRSRGALITTSQPYNEDMREELVDAEPEEVLRRVEEGIQLMIAETESDSDDFDTPRGLTSPSIARSAFVANSALPLSPILSHRRPSVIHETQYDEEESDPGPGLVNADDGSMSSAAMQLRIEDDVRGRTDDSSGGESSNSGHRSKRRRTESTTPNERMTPAQTTAPEHRSLDRDMSLVSSIPESPSASVGSYANDQVIRVQLPAPTPRSVQPSRSEETELNNSREQTPEARRLVDEINEADGDREVEDGEDAEEYVVEAIIDHYHDDVGKKWYLVKWQGYEDSHDWLANEDLEGAAELVAEYNAKIRRKKKARG
jgi:hypothetical protein